LTLQYAFNQFNMSIVMMSWTASFISSNSLNLCFFQSIAVDSNVVLWAQVLDWIPPNMDNVENVQKLLERMLPKAFFEHVHYTLGSLSQVIQGGFPQADFMDSIHQICPQMTAVAFVAFELIKKSKVIQIWILNKISEAFDNLTIIMMSNIMSYNGVENIYPDRIYKNSPKIGFRMPFQLSGNQL